MRFIQVQPPPAAGAKPARTGRKPGGRMALPEWLAHQTVVVDLPESERIGPDGTPLPGIGRRTSWRLDFVQAHFERVCIETLIYGLPFQEDLRLLAPPLPAVVPHGLPVFRASLDNWIAQVATRLAPIHAAIGAAVLARPVLSLDDTYLPVLEPGKGHCHQGRLWGYLVGDDFHHGLFVTGERTLAGNAVNFSRPSDAA